MTIFAARLLLVSAALVFVSPSALHAQTTFTDVAPIADGYFDTDAETDFWMAAMAPADFDADGDQDLAVFGFFVVYGVSTEYRLVILRNDGVGPEGRWVFVPVPLPLGDLYSGESDLAWGDYDGDGDYDLVVGSERMTRLYRNDAGQFVDSQIALPGYNEGQDSGGYDLRSITWADYDNDGDQDLFLPTTDTPTPGQLDSILLRNDGADAGGNWQFAEVRNGLGGGRNMQTAWIDDDNDGDLDLLTANSDNLFDSGFIRRYRNDAGSFVGADMLDVSINVGLADWGDIDADGRTDILVAGNVLDSNGSYSTVVRIHRRRADGGYDVTHAGEPALPWLDVHAANWADFDSDGDVDLLVTGSIVGTGEIIGRSLVYLNDGAGHFTPLGIELPAPQSSIGRGGAFTWFDLDGDGDLDYFVAGAYPVPNGNGLVEARIELFRNDTIGTNLAPSAPPQPSAVLVNGALELSWLPASDDHSPASSLTYEVAVRRVGAAVAQVERLPQPGAQGDATQWTLHGLPPGDYLWNVQAIDSAWNSGPKSAGGFSIVDPGVLFANGFE